MAKYVTVTAAFFALASSFGMLARADLIVGSIVPNSSPTAYDALRFDDSGKLLGVFAAASNGLHRVGGITIGPNNDVFIADRDPHQILRYRLATGELLGVFSVLHSLSWTNEITFGPDGNLYVADAQ